MLQSMLKDFSSDFRVHMFFERLVLVLYFLRLKDLVYIYIYIGRDGVGVPTLPVDSIYTIGR